MLLLTEKFQQVTESTDGVQSIQRVKSQEHNIYSRQTTLATALERLSRSELLLSRSKTTYYFLKHFLNMLTV